MRVLHAAWRYDPTNPDAASGVDFNVYQSLVKNSIAVDVIGPYPDSPILPERILRKSLKLFHRKYLKYDFSSTWRASQELNRAVKKYSPDVIFTLFPPPLVWYREKTPCVYAVDTTFWGWQQIMKTLGPLSLQISLLQEKLAFKHCHKVITYSEWSRDILVNQYHLAPQKVEIIVMPAALPADCIPTEINLPEEKILKQPLQLLLVGRDYKGKGVDIAIHTVDLLNARGIKAELTVCGTWGSPHPNVRFVGPYKKADPEQLRSYIQLYRNAHLLIHPSLFEGAGIVPGEAAAFATPTVTNATSALSTTVKNGVSGIVLPQASPAEHYAEAIAQLISSPETYYSLCKTTRTRYEQELNWDVAGSKFIKILEETSLFVN